MQTVSADHERSRSRLDLAELHREYARTRSPEVRNELVRAHCGLAEGLARRIGSRGGDSIEDMVQVAYLALIKAVDRFDPELGFQFSTYATRVITGELKRHLRDHAWTVKPPRGVHDLYLAAEAAADDLTHELGRSPTIPELAERVGATEEHLLDAMEAGRCRYTRSLNRPVTPDGVPLAEVVGDNDDGFARLEGRLLLDALLPRLDDEAKFVLELRFRDGLSQAEIARRLNTSQMNVSRTLRRTLDRLGAAAHDR